MAAERQQHRQQRSRSQPPFLLALPVHQAEYEQEHRYGAHIHRAGGEGLGAPIGRKALAYLREVGLTGPAKQFHGFRLHAQLTRRRSAVVIGYDEVGKFLPAVGPGRCIVDVEALGAAFPCAALGGAAAHRIRSVLPGGKEARRIGRDSGESQHQQQHRGKPEVLLRLLAGNHPYEQHKYVQQYDDGKIIGNLRMMGLDLEGNGNAEKGRTEAYAGKAPALAEPLLNRLAVGENQGCKHPGHVCQGHHLGVVTNLDDLQIVRAEGDGDGASGRDQRTDAKRQHQQEGSQKRYEEIRSRTPARQQEIIDRLGDVARTGAGECDGGHAAEHRFRPGGGLAGMRLVPLLFLVSHSHPAGDIGLIDHLAGKDVGNERVGEYQEAQHYAGDYEYLFLHASIG